MHRLTPEEIDQLLPQTQCGLCGYGGCMPYAEALIFENAAINLCPPGGVKTLRQLGKLLQQDAEPFIAEMEQKTKPKLLAVVREAECIGCTKCIQACPVDAILGSAKQMHTVISDECTGCELCVPPCPVDCIDVITHPNPELDSALARQRYQTRSSRLAKESAEKKSRAQVHSVKEKQQYISDAITRAKLKKAK